MSSSLHNHTEYSVLDGFSHPEEYLKRAKEIGLHAFAVTEHGNEYSWPYFDKLKKKYPEIKMIYGVELYECFDIKVQDPDNKYFHLIALAKNEKGRIALNEIVTKSNFEGFYYKPRVDLEMLKPYADDLIVMSACLASKISREKDYEKCLEYIREYKNIFPYFFLEMQSHRTDDQAEYNKKILQLAHDTNTLFTITTDSHAATKEDLYYQARHVQIARDNDTIGETYEGCYIQSDDEIYEVMDSQIGRENVELGLENSDMIADMIDEVDMPFQSPQLPTFPLPEGFSTNYDYLKYLCEEGWHRRNIDKMSPENQKVRRDRLNYELGIIHQMGFDGYFLIVWDFIKWAKIHDIGVGPGRGCFLPDSDVLLANGFTKKIIDVEPGDYVVTHLGNIKQVHNRFEYDCNEKMYSIKHSYFDPIQCTYNHQLYAVKQGECYKYPRITDKSKCRRFCSNSCKKYKTCTYKKDFVPSWIEAKDLCVGDYLCYPKNKELEKLSPAIIDLSKYDPELNCDGKFEKNNITNGTSRILQDENYIYFPILNIGTFDYDGKVYDLNVEDDHSYVINNAAVHNSGGGAIVDYLLGISELDPISYGLIFERFLNPERVSMPDIDSDFSDREKVVEYLMHKYGEDRVCQVINFSYITPVVAIKDVGRILGIPYKVCDKISKKFTYPTFEECVENNPTLYEEYADYKELFDIAGKISGRVRQTSVHAGGVGIVDTKVTDYMGMKLGSKGEHVIQVDKKIIEEIGIIKFDCLGLADTLNTIKECVEYAHIDPYEIDVNNPEFLKNKDMYKLLCSADTNGVFQVESQGMKDLLLRLQPSNLEDVSAVLALYRPDSMGALDEYIECKHGRKKVHYIHPDMEPILKDTYGCLLYQEQIMEIVRKFGGRTYGGSDRYRKAIGKKNLEMVKQESEKLYQEIIDNGYSEDIARQISDELSQKGGYCFNRSHSALYAIITLQTAYLKAKYPTEFFCGLLNQKRDDYGALNKYIIDSKNFNVKILPPHINRSDRIFSVYNEKILFGLEAIKGVGEKFVDALIDERSIRKFDSFDDFYGRMSPSIPIVISLTKAGAIPCKNKKEFLLSFAKSQFRNKEYTPLSTLPKLSVLKEKYGIDGEVIKAKEDRLKLYNTAKMKEFYRTQDEKNKKNIAEFTDKYLKNEDLWEFEALSVFLTYNPFEKAYEFIEKPFENVEEGNKGIIVGVIANIQKKKDRTGKQFAFIWMYSAFGLIEATCWHTQLKQYEDLIKRGTQVAMLCTKSDDKAIVKEMKSYDQWIEDRQLKQRIS